MPLGSTGEHWDLYLGRENRDNQQLAHCQIHSRVSTRHQLPHVCPWHPSCLLLQAWNAAQCNPRGRKRETPAQRSSGMSCVFQWSSLHPAVHPMEQEVAEDHTWMWHRRSLSSQSFPQQHYHTLGVTRNKRWEKPTSAHCSERDRDLRTSNNYIEQLKPIKPGKLNARAPSSCSTVSVWRWLRAGGAPCAHPVGGMHMGHGHCSGGSRGHWGSARPGSHWLPLGRSPSP